MCTLCTCTLFTFCNSHNSNSPGLVGVVPALGMLTVEENPPDGPVHLTVWDLLLWSTALAFFGACFAPPLRQQTIVREQLPFPSGSATAYVIKTLHAQQGGGGHAFRVCMVCGCDVCVMWEWVCVGGKVALVCTLLLKTCFHTCMHSYIHAFIHACTQPCTFSQYHRQVTIVVFTVPSIITIMMTLHLINTMMHMMMMMGKEHHL